MAIGTPHGRDPAVGMSTGNEKERLLLDLTDERIAYMDAAGIDVQVLSVTTTGVQNLEPAQAIPLARDANERIAATIQAHPDRFQGFATLPTSDPHAAADELERAVVDLGLDGAMVFGRTGNRNIDHPDFQPILQRANALHAPLYLRPQSPPPPVRGEYYEGLPRDLATMFATGGIGWHYETDVQALRLILSGTLDQLPDLPLILGHWGEVVMFYLDRIDIMTAPAGLPRPVSDYFTSNMYITPSGIFSQRYLQWGAVEVVGTERLLFSTDYPFGLFPDGAARQFLVATALGEDERRQFAETNWQRLRAGIRRQPTT
jgi:uncharacterized protein